MNSAFRSFLVVLSLFCWLASATLMGGEKPSEPAPGKKAEKAEAAAKKDAKGQEILEPVVEPTPEYATKVARIHAIKKRELEERIKKNIMRLVTSGGEVARADLIKIGKPAIPFLIDALSVPEDPKKKLANPHAYQLQGPIRSTRNRPLSEVAHSVLHSLFLHNSTYKGKLPGLDQKAWKELWNQHGEEIELGRRWP